MGTLRHILSRWGGGSKAVCLLLVQCGSGCRLEGQLRAGVHALRKPRGQQGARA